MGARIVFLAGGKSGTVVELNEGEVSVGRSPDCTVVLDSQDVVASSRHATFFVHGGRCFVRDDGSRNGTFVNGVRVDTVELHSGQQISFGPNGPTARFEIVTSLQTQGAPATPFAPPPPRAKEPRHVTAAAAPGASGLTGLFHLARAQAGEAAGGRASNTAVMKAFVKLATERSSRRTRVTVTVVLATALLGMASIFVIGQRQQSALRSQLVSLSSDLAGERGSRAELEERLHNLSAQAQSWQEQTAELRAQSQSVRAALAQSQEAAARQQREIEQDRRFGPMVTERYAQGVCLIEMSWGYRNAAGEWLRIRGSPDGQVRLAAPNDVNAPRLTKGGAGTGFLIEESGWILTNRHVSEPFADDEGLRLGGDLYRPQWISRRAYFPPGTRAFDVEVMSVSSEHDLGLMRTSARPSAIPTLPIASRASNGPGDKLVLLGYPTGEENIMWRANDTQLESIRRASQLAAARVIRDGGFEGVVKLIEQIRARTVQVNESQAAGATLVLRVVSAAANQAAMQEAARLGLVQPHVSMGAVTDTTRSDVFHSAAMVGGASGGPVVGGDLRVISVNYAMNVSEDRGAVFQKNRSVPYPFVWRFLPPDLATKIRAR